MPLASTCKTSSRSPGATHCQFADSGTHCELGESCSADITREQQHALTRASSHLGSIGHSRGMPPASRTSRTCSLGGQGITSVESCPLPPTLDEATWSIRLRNIRPTQSIHRRHADPFRNPREACESRSSTSGRRVRSSSTPASMRALTDHLEWKGRRRPGTDLPAGGYYCRIRSGANPSGGRS